jgi:hypothetical protein
MRLAQIRRLTLVSMSLAVAACAAGPLTVTTQSAACSTLLPDDWRKGIAAAPLPDGDTVGDWVAFADATVGKLDQANGRTRDAIEIVSRCEARDAAAIKSATHRRFLGLF